MANFQGIQLANVYLGGPVSLAGLRLFINRLPYPSDRFLKRLFFDCMSNGQVRLIGQQQVINFCVHSMEQGKRKQVTFQCQIYIRTSTLSAFSP
ncbi:hypothetical protein SAMN05192553_105261 [Cyclobacterium xiamenense]|uniref:Uncharacterized protein n=1 Tax=Cyclobacterium xiamenense TaxID=1297121 RepID=A0A1H7A027_9BACT|nr:hypothetical protein SAMN05192553_105261 [Cyclobacterium xiamenense]